MTREETIVQGGKLLREGERERGKGEGEGGELLFWLYQALASNYSTNTRALGAGEKSQALASLQNEAMANGYLAM